MKIKSETKCIIITAVAFVFIMAIVALNAWAYKHYADMPSEQIPTIIKYLFLYRIK